MIEVKIGAAAHSLSANERKLLALLKEGKTPYECARIMGIPFSYGGVAYPPPCNIMDMISNIRAAGHELPKINNTVSAAVMLTKKEDKAMDKKYSADIVARVRELRAHGYKLADISRELNIPEGTVKRFVYGKKEKPAPEESDTGKEILDAAVDESAAEGIVSQPAEKVKYSFCNYSKEVMANAISEYIDMVSMKREQVDEAMSNVAKKQAELEAMQEQLIQLQKDYEYMCGGNKNGEE